MAMVKRSELVDALAAVAVSALSGPLGAIGVSAACELVKLLQKARGRTSEEKELQKQVREAITAWAKGERLDPDVVDRGLAWAIEYVQAAGCQHELIAEADFDPTRAAEAVLTPAKARDEYWGTDPEYGVAERAVHVTYNALCPKLKAEGGVVLAAIQASRNEIRGSIDQLREDLLGAANRHELIDYLEKQIRDWDYSPWTQGRKWTQDRRPSQLERTLEIADEQRTMSPAEALEGIWLLAVLGGPGSGKTWLAQRLAREAAETALEQLRDPRVDPASVELPLVTTVADWIKQRGTGFEGLVKAALQDESQEKIRRLVLRSGVRVLAVADSLDEGVAVNQAKTLLNSLTISPTRLVVTSRPEAWHSAASGLCATQDTRVGTLTELRYPKDVHGYIEAWFKKDPSTAKHLIRQLERRRELRTTATSPLLLTFYCMLTEQEPDRELPRRRRELYRTIIDLLLAGGWATMENPVDRVACRAILQQWAWDAVKDAVTPAGLGVWPETITTDRRPPDASEAMERALDNVAPKQEHPRSSLYDHARVERRFLHRTLWEYLVSEHIATFSAAKAAKALLPHIWFDPDWQITLPMAIAAHQKRSKLADQLWTHHTDHPAPAQKVVNDRLEELILEVAAQTDPEDWNKASRAQIRSLRESFAPHHPEMIIGSAHWGSPSHVEAILAELLGSALWRVPDLVFELSALGPNIKERAEARRAILATLASLNWIFTALNGPSPGWVPTLVHILLSLEPSDKEREKARHDILTTLTSTYPQEVPDLVFALCALEPNTKERAEAQKAIFATLTKAFPQEIPKLVLALSSLKPNDKEGEKARRTILTTLTNTHPQEIPDLVLALSSLKPNDKEREKARHIALTSLTKTDTPTAKLYAATPNLSRALLSLEPEEEGRTKARQTILTTLPNANPIAVCLLVRVLRTLGVTDNDRAKARHTILTTLTNSDPQTVSDLIGEFSALEPTDKERMKARHTILTALTNAEPGRVPALVRALSELKPNDEERTEARHTILTALTSAEPWDIPNIVPALSTLEPTDEERTKARQIILTIFPRTESTEVHFLTRELRTLGLTDDERTETRRTILTVLTNTAPHTILDLISELLVLEPTDEEQTEARQIILTKLANADSIAVCFLVRELRALRVTDDERTEARRSILTALTNTDPRTVPDLIGELSALEPTDKERMEARRTILTTLTNTNPWAVPYLVAPLSKLEISDEERTEARKAILTALINADSSTLHELVGLLRQFTPVHDWLAELGIEST